MGLERTAAVLQGVDTIHHTDLFAPLINAINDLSRNRQIEYSISPLEFNTQDPTTKPLKIIADHVRAAIFMAGDGIVPGNNGRDYMMKRFIRRAFLTARQLDLREPFLHKLVPIVSQGFGDVYPEIRERETAIAALIKREEEAFGKTINSGMNRLEDLLEDAKKKQVRVLDGEEVFRLYETYGFPKELTQEMAQESGLEIDEAGYHAAQERHSKISGSAVGEYYKSVFGSVETKFAGYDMLSCDAEVLAVTVHAEDVGNGVTEQTDSLFLLDRTPFYGESGGQIGDHVGEIIGDGVRLRVLDTQKQGKTIFHKVEIH